MNEKQRVPSKAAGPDSNIKLPGHFLRKAVFSSGAVVHQDLPEGDGVGLKEKQGTYGQHHRLEPLMRIASPLFDRNYAFPQQGIRQFCEGTCQRCFVEQNSEKGCSETSLKNYQAYCSGHYLLATTIGLKAATQKWGYLESAISV